MDRLSEEEKETGGREGPGGDKWQFKKREGWTRGSGAIFSVKIKLKLLRQLILACKKTGLRR